MIQTGSLPFHNSALIGKLNECQQVVKPRQSPVKRHVAHVEDYSNILITCVDDPSRPGSPEKTRKGPYLSARVARRSSAKQSANRPASRDLLHVMKDKSNIATQRTSLNDPLQKQLNGQPSKPALSNQTTTVSTVSGL